MTKELQIMRLKELFRLFNPQGDIQEIDFEAHVDPDLPLPGNIALMATYYPIYVWRKEELLEEMVSPETVQMREERARRIELEKERREHLEKIEAQEQRLRGEVERVVSEEIGALKEELEDLKAQRDRIPTASLEELGELRKDMERTERTIRELGVRTTLFWEKLKKLDMEKREIRPPTLPTPEEIVSPEILQSRLAQLPIFPSIKAIQYWNPELRQQFYPWWEDVPCKITKGIRERRVSFRDFIEVGIPSEWVNKQIELCREEYRKRGMLKEAGAF